MLKQKSSFKHLSLCLLSEFSGLALKQRFDVIFKYICYSLSNVSLLYIILPFTMTTTSFEMNVQQYLWAIKVTFFMFVFLNIIWITIFIYVMLTSVISKEIIFKMRHFCPRLKEAMQIHDWCLTLHPNVNVHSEMCEVAWLEGMTISVFFFSLSISHMLVL